MANVGTRPGPAVKHIAMTTNDRQNVTVTLDGEVNVLSAVRVEPDAVTFAQLKRDAPEQQSTLTIKRGDAGPIHPRVITTGNPIVKANLREVEAGEKYELEVTLSPPWPNNVIQSNVQIDTGVKEAPQENIRVFANVIPRLQAAPPRFMIQSEPRSDLDLSVRLNWDGAPGKILEATPSDPATTARVSDENGHPVVFLHVPAGYNPTNRTGQSVTIKTDDPVVPTMQVPLFITAQPVVGASPAAQSVGAAQARPSVRAAAPPPPRPATTQPAQPESPKVAP